MEVEQVTSITVFTNKILVVFVFFGVVEFHDVRGVEIFHAVDFSFEIVEEVGFFHETFHADKFEGELLAFVCFD